MFLSVWDGMLWDCVCLGFVVSLVFGLINWWCVWQLSCRSLLWWFVVSMPTALLMFPTTSA